jgi:hypothetical protein
MREKKGKIVQGDLANLPTAARQRIKGWLGYHPSSGSPVVFIAPVRYGSNCTHHGGALDSRPTVSVQRHEGVANLMATRQLNLLLALLHDIDSKDNRQDNQHTQHDVIPIGGIGFGALQKG